ncbi:DUF4139 domain-containing protein [Pontixanthobacter aquaemixtae]|uniref:DUF4139 domain-containing protein n=1 Tax=Pontixanthobacter aquaemixtae TaxID=1958940 RepID=A0A844ZQE7_9SPHN|nr:hypothetical protein [Pontixanthobacter aquaemixtae]MXO90561.1 hypothetical protein [Pontixanthobacter aquaemixtae]
MRRLFLSFLLVAGACAPATAREVVTASEPDALAITVYRDPDRYLGQEMDRDWPQGIAMITETRTVTLPAGESTIRFDGVAEGMVAVSAIVTGLPGGTIEKNRNADLLSPAALLDGTLGNRVRVSRTNPATGATQSESAIVRTRADGGLVLQTQEGYEAVRCSGLPEKLTFDRVPTGLSANPVFSIDTRDETGGTYQVQLTYIAWGFDWQANYVATLADTGAKGDVDLRLMSWLTILNDNGQSFPDADLMAVAGTINITSDFEQLSDPPTARPLRLTCYPIGSTAAGTPVYYNNLALPAPPPSPMMMESASPIVVTGARVKRDNFDSAAPLALVAKEEQLGDLKLYRIPEQVDVAAQGLKQVAFLDKQRVRAQYLYMADCDPYDGFNPGDDDRDISELDETYLFLTMKNLEERGLGAALPMGGVTLFEPGPAGTHLVAELDMRDYAVGQDIELEIGESTQVFSQCARTSEDDPDELRKGKWVQMRAQISNANNHPVQLRLKLGDPADYEVRWPRQKRRVKNGSLVVEVTIPANAMREFDWKLRNANRPDDE